MKLKDPLYCCPLEAEELQKCLAEGDKRGARRQIRELSDILPEPFGDEYAERLYTRQMKLTSAIGITAGVPIFLGAAGMELSDAFFPGNDALFLVLFCITMAGVLAVTVLLLSILSIRRKLIEHYLAGYTPVCTHFDENTRKMCGRALLFSSDDEQLIGGGAVEDDELAELTFGNNMTENIREYAHEVRMRGGAV